MFAAALSFFPPCAAPAAEEVPQRAQACTVCHGPGGNSTDPAVPSLAGQPAQFVYLRTQLRGFKAKIRADFDGNMTSVAELLSERDIEILADYLSGLTPARD